MKKSKILFVAFVAIFIYACSSGDDSIPENVNNIESYSSEFDTSNGRTKSEIITAVNNGYLKKEWDKIEETSLTDPNKMVESNGRMIISNTSFDYDDSNNLNYIFTTNDDQINWRYMAIVQVGKCIYNSSNQSVKIECTVWQRSPDADYLLGGVIGYEHEDVITQLTSHVLELSHDYGTYTSKTRYIANEKNYAPLDFTKRKIYLEDMTYKDGDSYAKLINMPASWSALGNALFAYQKLSGNTAYVLLDQGFMVPGTITFGPSQQISSNDVVLFFTSSNEGRCLRKSSANTSARYYFDTFRIE